MLIGDELKDRILEEGYDECLICDILEISTEDLLDKFKDRLEMNRDKFLDEKDRKVLDF